MHTLSCVSKHLTGKPLDPHEGVFCCLYQESLSGMHCTAIVISQQNNMVLREL